MRTSAPLLAIYDETEMQRQLLHHQIEHLGFQVAFSSSQKETFLENLEKGNPPQTLLINGDHYSKKILPILHKINFRYANTFIIVYLCDKTNVPAYEFIKAGAKKVIESCNIEKLVGSLDLLYPAHPGSYDGDRNVPTLFSHLLKNKKNLLILQALAKSKTEKEIGELTKLSPSTVKTYKQRMKDELGCKTTGELLALAKDHKII